MNYKLTNFEIRKAEGARISGQELGSYLYCTAYNPMNRFEKTHNIVIFDKGMVEHYANILPEGRGGNLPDQDWSENNMDVMDKIFTNGCTVEYDLNGLYCRKYTADIIDANGNVIPGKAKGDIIRDVNNNPIVFSKIPVFCQYAFKTEAVLDDFGRPVIDKNTGDTKVKIIRDETGRPIEEWVQGWSPSEVGESMRRLLTPYTAEMNSAVAHEANPNIEVEESPDVFGDSQNGQQQQQQQQNSATQSTAQ